MLGGCFFGSKFQLLAQVVRAGSARKEGLDDLDDGWYLKNRSFQPRSSQWKSNQWKWPHVFFGCVAILFVSSFFHVGSWHIPTTATTY